MAVQFEIEDDEVSEVSYSVAYEKLEEEASVSFSYERLDESFKENHELVKSEEKPVRRDRPYKVCGGKSKDRKGIVASSFKELVEKAKNKFANEETDGDLTLVLNDDKTEVDDEEYFQSLANNTVFLMVQTVDLESRGRTRTRHCNKAHDKKHKCKRKKSKDGLKEISKILEADGAVAGKGEKIEKKKTKTKAEKVDVVTQVDSFTLELELNQSSLDLSRRSADYAPVPRLLAAQLIHRLENHKRTLQRENNFEMSFENNFHPEPSTDQFRD